MKKVQRSRGFTLIELLVVIGIIVILSVVVVLTLNPAELLKQARDSNRISDMATMKSSLALYLADVTSPNLASTTAANCSGGGTNCCYAHASSGLMNGAFSCTAATATSTRRFDRAGTYATTSALTTPLAVNALGWIPVNFTEISSGAPVTALPVDAVNNGSYFYAYTAATNSVMTYKLTTHMESTKYSKGGSGDVETTDGGSTNGSSTYEVGSQLGL